MAFDHDLSLSVDGTIAVQLNIVFNEHEDKPDELRVKVFKEDKTKLEAEAVCMSGKRMGKYRFKLRRRIS